MSVGGGDERATVWLVARSGVHLAALTQGR